MTERFDPAHYARYRGMSRDRIESEFAWKVPTELNLAVDACDRWVGEDRPAMGWIGTDGSERTLTFADFSELSNRAASMLRSLGVERGDRVTTMLPRVPEHYALLLGIHKLGAVGTVMAPSLGKDAMLHRLADAGSKVFVTQSAWLERLEGERPPTLDEILLLDGTGDGGLEARLADATPRFEAVTTTPSDTAYLFYTSGTTGEPKAAVHGHAVAIGWALLVKIFQDVADDDVYWPTSDLGWLTGHALVWGAWLFGNAVHIYEGEYDAAAWSRIMRSRGVTNFFTVPTAYRMMRRDEEHFGDLSLRHLGTVGEPLDAVTLAWAQRTLGAPIHEIYGQTEHAAGLIGNLPGMEIRPASMGRTLPWMKAAVVDESGRELPPGEVGEIVDRPDYPYIFRGYWNRPEDTEGVFRNGWHWTGDLAVRDEDGYFHFRGRADDVILSSGYRIGPTEIEAALLRHPDVVEAAVVGVPDSVRGELVTAFVVVRPGLEAPGAELGDELKTLVRRHVGGYAHPRRIAFVDELPKTPTGKVRRVELRERAS